MLPAWLSRANHEFGEVAKRRFLGIESGPDLWAGTTRETAGTITATVPADSAMLLRVSPLRGPVINRYAPFTFVSVSPDVPPAYLGSQFEVAQPGQAVSVPAALENEGREPVTHAVLSLTGPSGWGTGAAVSAPVLPTGQVVNSTWQVTVPSGTAAGTYTLTATATFRWGGKAGSNSAQTSVQVVVPPNGTPTLDQLSWLSAVNGFSSIGINENHYGGPLSIHGTVYPHGLWVNSVATIYYYLGGTAARSRPTWDWTILTGARERWSTSSTLTGTRSTTAAWSPTPRPRSTPA